MAWWWQLIYQSVDPSLELCKDARKSAHRRAGAGNVTHSERFLCPLCLVDQELRVADQVIQTIYFVGHGISLPVAVRGKSAPRPSRRDGAAASGLRRPWPALECPE